jgi:hypothetical protein
MTETLTSKQSSMHPCVSVLQTCMSALDQSDYATIKGLFTPGGNQYEA